MAELVFRLLGVLLEGLIDKVFEHTGRKLLSFWGVKSNALVEVLIGFLFWVGVCLVFVLGALAFKLIAR